jgi:DNA-binding transcriptional LysR family regulator
MDIQDLHIFARVAAIQNLSAVGTELGLTPGTISKRIQALEETLAVRLFERTTRSIRITEEGTRFLGHAQRILSEMDQARSSMAASVGKPVGKLKISAPQIIGQRFIAPALFSFMAEYSDVEVQLDITDRQVNLHEEGYDIAIRSGALHDSAPIAKRLSPDRTVIVGSPAYFAAQGTPETPDELANHQCLVLGDAWSWPIGAPGRETAVRVAARFRSDSSEVLRLAALAGQGLIRSSELKLADDLAARTLVSVLGQFIDNSSTGVYALYSGGRHILPRQRVFLDHLAEWFRTHRRSIEPLPVSEASVLAISQPSSVRR